MQTDVLSIRNGSLLCGLVPVLRSMIVRYAAVLFAWVAIVPSSRAAEWFFWSDSLPPSGGEFVSPAESTTEYGSTDVRLRNWSLVDFTPSYAPPALGDTQILTLVAQADLQLSLDGGTTFSNATAPANIVLRATLTNMTSMTRFLETEVLQLEIAGGSLQPGVVIRAHPTQASLGLTTIRSVSGGYRIEIFLDVNTEVSIDGGQTWNSATQSIPLSLTVTAAPPFIDFGALWKYLDDGSDQSVFWRESAYDDSLWRSGPAQLGYGDGDESTVINGGPSTDRIISCYFRHTFVVEDASVISNLLVRLIRDDGGVVYMNGTEVFRSNMPTGEIDHTTLALDVSSGTDGTTNFYAKTIDPGLLLTGANLLAVEIHQAAHDGTNVSFDLALVGNFVPLPPTVSITDPTHGATLTAANLHITASATDCDGTVTQVGFYQGNTLLGEVVSAPFALTWSNVPSGNYVLTAVALDEQGLSATSAPVAITVIAPPPTFIPTGAIWNYLADGSDQGDLWLSPAFDDASWPSGPAPLGFGVEDLATRIGDRTNGFITFYFRNEFFVEDPSAYSNLVVRLLRDDGGIVYLNGWEIFRSNMPEGPVDFLTPALTVIENAG